jgi:hypothetical protein
MSHFFSRKKTRLHRILQEKLNKIRYKQQHTGNHKKQRNHPSEYDLFEATVL